MRIAVLAVAIMISGCSCDDGDRVAPDGAVPGEGGTASLGAFYAAACDYFTRCEGTFGHGFVDASTCEGFYSSVFECSIVAALVREAFVRVDAARLAVCVDALRSAPCGGSEFPGAEACSDIILGSGTARPGEACPDDLFGCSAGSYCHYETDCSVCVAYAAAGEDCSAVNCAQGLRCDSVTNRCAEKLPVGGACEDQDDCASDACSACTQEIMGGLTTTRCSGTGTCYEPIAAGEPCAPDRRCAGFRICSGGTCADRRDPGTPCATDGECTLDSWCVGGTCAAIPLCAMQPVGARCATFGLVTCAAGTHCDNDTDRCIADVPIGGMCSSSSDCGSDASCDATSRCVARVPSGGSCSGGEPCAPGTECSATGTCEPPQADGTSCTNPGQCESGYCDGTSMTCGSRPACAA